VESLHWLILIPFYFFGALTCLLLFILLTRILRLSISINVIASTAVAIGLGFVIIPLLVGWVELRDYTARRMLILAVASLLLAALDVLLKERVPLSLDRDLDEL
jgi:hypothetical protein